MAAETSNRGDPLLAATSTARRRPDLVLALYCPENTSSGAFGGRWEGAALLRRRPTPPFFALFPRPLELMKVAGLRAPLPPLCSAIAFSIPSEPMVRCV